MATALLLVDLQNDFCAGGQLAVLGADEVIPLANQLQQHFAHIIATKDWHPADHGSFAANQPSRQVGEMVLLNGVEQILWPVHCVQHSAGSDFHPQLQVARIEHIVYKGTQASIDSYSAFFDMAHLHQTDLDGYLRANAIDTLYILGLATDYCVKYTVLDALELGYQVKVVVAGCRAVNLRAGDGERALQEMVEKGAQIVDMSFPGLYNTANLTT